MKKVLQKFFLIIGLGLSKLFLDLTITGRENLPPTGKSLIVISNHFSWFEAPLMQIHLPYHIAYLAAKELERLWYIRILMRLFDVIPIWRGQIDRRALQAALKWLRQDGVIGIFPEGGVDPDLQATIASGEMIMEVDGHISRHSAELIPARPGASYLALRSQAQILPVAFLGTEKVLDNLRRLRRTTIKMAIGPVFGPIGNEEALRDASRREKMNAGANTMMRHLAAQLPPQNRGPYG